MATFVTRYDRAGNITGIQAKVRLKGWEPQSQVFATKALAKIWATNTEADLRAGRNVNLKEAETVTLADAIDRFDREVIAKKLKKKSKETARCTIVCFKRVAIGKRALTNITTRDVQELIDAWEEDGYASGTIRQRITYLSAVYKRAIDNWHYTSLRNPTRGVTLPPPAEGRTRRCHPAEEKRILKQLSGSAKPWWASAVFKFALLTAGRIREITSLQWEDVKFLSNGLGTALFRDTKNSKRKVTNREIPLSEDAVDLLKSIPRAISGPVFQTTYSAFRYHWWDALEAEKIEDLHIHDLRHEALTRLGRTKRFNVIELARISGHTDLKSLDRYVNPTAEELAEQLPKRGRHAASA